MCDEGVIETNKHFILGKFLWIYVGILFDSQFNQIKVWIVSYWILFCRCFCLWFHYGDFWKNFLRRLILILKGILTHFNELGKAFMIKKCLKVVQKPHRYRNNLKIRIESSIRSFPKKNLPLTILNSPKRNFNCYSISSAKKKLPKKHISNYTNPTRNFCFFQF